MRAVLMAVLATGLASAVAAQTKCKSGSADVVRVTSWSAKPMRGGAELMVEYANATTKPIKMLDATIWFTDALGGSIGGAKIDRDARIQPGAKAQSTLRYVGAFERLPALDKQDVEALACASAVLFEDGEKQSFK